MKNIKKIVAVAFIAVLLIYSVKTGTERKQVQPITPQQTDSQDSETTTVAIPDFVFEDTDGNVLSFADFKGKPVVINFWATWCPFCVKELPDFDRAAAEYGDRVNFIFLDEVDGQRESVENGKAYWRRNNFENIVTYYDTGMEGYYTFGANSLPTTFFADKDGNLYGYKVGMMTYEQITGALEELCK